MKVLVACECSGRIKTAFRNRGHDAWSCDLKPSEIPDDKYHIQDDVLEHLDGWDLMIAHPPCTYLCNSGVRWLSEREGRTKDMLKAVQFFNALKNAPIEKIAIENPIPHKYALSGMGNYSQKIQPYYFGEPESKATCLWLKNLPPLMFSFTGGEGIKQSTWREPPSPERKANRARTFKSIADAMANQWG